MTTKFSDLPAVTALANIDQIPVLQGGVNKKAAISDIRTTIDAPLIFKRETAWECNQGGYSESFLTGTFTPTAETMRVEFDLTGVHSGVAHISHVLGYKPGSSGPVRAAYYADPMPEGAVHVPLTTTRTHVSVAATAYLEGLTPGQEYFFEVFVGIIGYSHKTPTGAGAQSYSIAASQGDSRFVYTYEWAPADGEPTDGKIRKFRVPDTVDEVTDFIESPDALEGELLIPNGNYGAVNQQSFSPDGRYLYMTAPLGTLGSIAKIDVTTMEIVDTHPGMAAASQSISGIAISADGLYMYVQGYGQVGVQNTLRKYAMSDLTTPIWSIDLGVNVRRGVPTLSPDGTRIATIGSTVSNFVVVVQDQGSTANSLLWGFNAGASPQAVAWGSNTELWVAAGSNLYRCTVPMVINESNTAGSAAQTEALGGAIVGMATEPLRNSLFLITSTGTYKFQCRYSNGPIPEFKGKVWERAQQGAFDNALGNSITSNIRGDILILLNNGNIFTLDGAQFILYAQPDLFWGTKSEVRFFGAS